MISKKNSVLVDRIEKSRGVARSSARTWACSLRRLNRDYSYKDWNNDLKWLRDPKILAKLKNIKNLTQRRNLAGAAAIGLALINAVAMKKRYDEWIKALRSEVHETSKKQEMTERQKKNYISWNDVIKVKKEFARTVRLKSLWKKNKLTNAQFLILQRFVVLSLYTDMDPLRLDFAYMRVVTDDYFKKMRKGDVKTNYLVTSKGSYRMYFWKFKTAKYKELPIVLRPSRQLVNVLKKWVKVLRNRFGPENLVLVYNHKGDPMNRNSLSKFLASIFVKAYDKRVSASMLRTIFLSHKYSQTDILEREQTAANMMHTRAVAEGSYIKKIPQ